MKRGGGEDAEGFAEKSWEDSGVADGTFALIHWLSVFLRALGDSAFR